MFVSFDIVQRWLRCSGYQVKYVRNITDIDDKIIRRAVQSGKRMSEVTSFYIDAMHADERALGVQTPDFEPRATDHVGDMLGIIQRLETNGLAYKSEDGDVNYARSEEHTYELQSLMRISYAVFCLKKTKKNYIQIQKN